MDYYSLSELDLNPQQGIVEQFRDVAADLMSMVDVDPLTGLPQQADPNMGSLSQLASPANGMTMPMMNQMMDPKMLPPEMLRQPMTQPNIQDPMGGQNMSMANNPGLNNIGI